MIDALRLGAGWALVWLLGIAAVAACLRRTPPGTPPGERAWAIGCGFFAGAFLLTLWMRALSFAHIDFSIATIGLSVAVAGLTLAWLGLPRLRWWIGLEQTADFSIAAPTRAARILIIALLAWLALRFAVLLLDVIWTPLYPWDAWIQWATKARVWYSLGHIVPFGHTDEWFAANGTIWFDAAPNYPATVPLWQVWSSVALGRWDDALMNVPWWLAAVALAIAVYGALRVSGTGPLGSLLCAWLVSSLPLANVHVALAGYADLPMAAYYTLAALGLWRWAQQRTLGNASVALLLALACPTIKTPGIVWALTLLPGVVLVLLPKRGRHVIAIALVAAGVALAMLARTSPVVLGYRLHVDFSPKWEALVGSLFLLGNWHLLWYAVLVALILGWTELRERPLDALSAIAGTGMLFLAVAFSFTNARNWVTDQTTVNRALLHIAPLALVWTVLVIRASLARRQARAAASVPVTAISVTA